MRGVASSPRACSGARYAAVPTTDPTWVIRVCSLARAMPKSASLMVISPPPAGPPMIIRFPGLTSRWMIPWRCA